MLCQVSSDKVRLPQVKYGYHNLIKVGQFFRLFRVISGYDRLGHVRSGYIRLGQVRSCYISLGRVRSV